MKKSLLRLLAIVVLAVLAVLARKFYPKFQLPQIELPRTQEKIETEEESETTTQEGSIENEEDENTGLNRPDNTVKKENSFFSFFADTDTQIMWPQEARFGGMAFLFDNISLFQEKDIPFIYSEQDGLFFDDRFWTQWRVKIKTDQWPWVHNPYLQGNDGGDRLVKFLEGIASSLQFKITDKTEYLKKLKTEYPSFTYQGQETTVESIDHELIKKERKEKLKETIRYSTNRYPWCDTNDIAVGRHIIAACNVGSSTASPEQSSLGKKYTRNQASSICAEWYHLPNMEERREIYKYFQNTPWQQPQNNTEIKKENNNSIIAIQQILLLPNADYRTTSTDALGSEGSRNVFDFNDWWWLRSMTSKETNLEAVRCFRGKDDSASKIWFDRYGGYNYLNEIDLISGYFDLLHQKRRDEARSLLFSDTPSPKKLEELYKNTVSIQVREIRATDECKWPSYYNATEILSLVDVTDKDWKITTYYGERRIYDDRIYVVSTKEVSFDYKFPCYW